METRLQAAIRNTEEIYAAYDDAFQAGYDHHRTPICESVIEHCMGDEAQEWINDFHAGTKHRTGVNLKRKQQGNSL